MKYTFIAVLLVLAVLTGCQTNGGGIHSVPVARDYGRLPDVSVREAAEELARAEQAAAQYDAPYAVFSAREYLAAARELRAHGDRLGARDYSALARRFAKEATQNAATATTVAPDTEGTTRDAFEHLKENYLALDRAGAIEAAPLYYAELSARVSRAEHALLSGRWQDAAGRIIVAQTALDRLVARDQDNDGVPDLQDGTPTEPEDVDGFEDEDGVPDLDNDRDGVPDAVDVAPDEAETTNNFQDEDGAADACPELERIAFAAGSAHFSAETQGYLRGLKLMLDCWPKMRLRIAGHVSAGKGDGGSIDLSRQRAEAVRAYLLECGVAERQIVTTYHGAYKPLPGIPPNDPRQSRVALSFE